MKCSNEPKPPAELKSFTLKVKLGQHIPSFKNSKRAILDSQTNKFRTLTPGPIKKRMNQLEDAITLELFSSSVTVKSGTPLECLKQLRTFLSGLCDDSIREIPCGSWDVRYVEPGQEGVEITITKLS